MSLRKAIYIILGCIGLILGAVGVIVPMLPAFPFLLLAAFGFARGSERLHSWFISTRLYKNNLETYVRGQGMTRRTKHRIIASVTVLILISMSILAICELYWVWSILIAVWAFHILYFVFGVKTLEP
ncbi:MAG: YbaN family protein [Peptococcaceae bacterium]|nr:YbaN family protein [Peptococcaceae bacterium]